MIYEILLELSVDNSSAERFAMDDFQLLYFEHTLTMVLKLNFWHSFSHCSTRVMVGTKIRAL